MTRYTSRNGIEDSLGSGVNFFHLDCLASEVPLNADLDAALTVLANGCYRWLASELHGFTEAKPKRLCRKIIETGGTVHVTEEHIHVHFQKRAAQSDLEASGARRQDRSNPLGRWEDPPLHIRRNGLTGPEYVSRFPSAIFGVEGKAGGLKPGASRQEKDKRLPAAMVLLLGSWLLLREPCQAPVPPVTDGTSTVTVLSEELTTKTRVPSGETAMPAGLFPTGRGRPTTARAWELSIVTWPLTNIWLLRTKTKAPSGVTATAQAPPPTPMGPPTTVGGSVVASSTVSVSVPVTKTRVPSGETAMAWGRPRDRDGPADDRGGIGRGVEHRDHAADCRGGRRRRGRRRV